MVGMIRWNEQQKKGVVLESVTVLRQPFLCAYILRRAHTPQSLLRRRVSAAGKRLRKQNVTWVVLPPGFPFAEELKKQGVTPVSTVPLRQEIAAPWVRACLAREGRPIAMSQVAVVAERLSAEVVRTVTELSMRHRYLLVCVPRGGEELARRLRREYGVSLRLNPSKEELAGAAAVAAFSPWEGEHPLTLRLYDETQPLPRLVLPPNQEEELPADLDRGQMIAALRRSGAVKQVEVEM